MPRNVVYQSEVSAELRDIRALIRSLSPSANSNPNFEEYIMLPKKPDMSKVAEWIDRCLTQNHKPLSEWEQRFLESVSDQLYHHGSLSEKQIEIIERIYAEKTP
jgi:hypothetical protein